MPRYAKFVPRHQFLKDRQKARMSDLRYQRQLAFSSRFPVRFSRPGRVSVPAAARNYLWELRRLYGYFPQFRKLPVTTPAGKFAGWRFYRNRYEWGQDFVQLVRLLRKRFVL